MAPSLCENCHTRPKFGTHRFCGKTCAAQAATKPVRSKQSHHPAKTAPRNAVRQGGPPPQKPAQLCTYCGQKPKFSGFDYCGKSCAALANTTQAKPSVTQGAAATKHRTANTPNTPSNNTSNTPAKVRKTPRVNVPAPQSDSSEEDEEPGEEEDGVSTDLDGYPSDSGSESEVDPCVPTVAVSQPNAKNALKSGKFDRGVSKIPPGTCTVPGCGKPSHVDRHGAKTTYCSMKHREEAVKLGLEEACIMCKTYPQSSSDYFCSSACKNQSMAKTT